jgi:uncharacterized membrane protein
MKKSWAIIVCGLLLGVAGYACVYFAGTSRQRVLSESGEPALAWLQVEFHLSDAEFAKIRELHEAYRPKCMEMCQQISANNLELQRLLATTNVVTPEIKEVLSQAAQLRAQCQANMLAHFYAVAQTMPPEEGQRYLAWVQKETLAPSPMMPLMSAPASAASRP